MYWQNNLACTFSLIISLYLLFDLTSGYETNEFKKISLILNSLNIVKITDILVDENII